MLARPSFAVRRSLATSVRRSLNTTTSLRTPPEPSQPERSAQSAAPAPFKLHDAITGLGESLESARQRLPDVKQYGFRRPSGRAMWGGAAAVVILSGVWSVSGDDGSSDPLVGLPNPADRACLSRVPSSKLLSGWV